MASWLHWIGEQFYDLESFLNEAKRLGVSRRVSANILKKMRFGDKIWLAGRFRKWRWAHVIGYFYLSKLEIIGGNKRIEEILKEKNIPYKVIPKEDAIVEEIRGCGRRVLGAGYIVTVPDIDFELIINEKAQIIVSENDIKVKYPEFNIGGKIYLLEKPTKIKIKRFRGFMKFNEEMFLRDLREGKSTFKVYWGGD